MSIAFVFPGQASAMVGMPAEWARRSAHARHLLDEASRRTATAVPRMTSAAGIARTSHFQPVLTALSLGIARELAECGVHPRIVAGHSLGELAACAVAGAMDDETAVALAALRGSLMEREAARHPGGMVALPPCDREAMEAAIAAGSKCGAVSLAAHNARDRWVLSGDWDALQEIQSRTGATRLAVAGPWHSSAMSGAVDEYRHALGSALSMPLNVPFVSNRTGAIVEDTPELIELLAGQLTHFVRWAESMAALDRSGVTRVIVCGPGKALRHSIESALPRAQLHIVEWPEDLARVQQELAA